MKKVLSPADVKAAIATMAEKILKSPDGPRDRWALIGIHTHGVPLARRLAAALKEKGAPDLPVGSLDITFYRDDVGEALLNPVVQDTDIPFDLTGRTIFLVDDVLYTGRTIRCALDELMDFGRPDRIRLAVLVDRGGRELPVQPDIVGRPVDAPAGERIEVRLQETDGEDGVWIVDNKADREKP
jgi:pyrimidine operon attenuation protein / uracil phosphoribosyltransferase